jgi:hypothetical protein
MSQIKPSSHGIVVEGKESGLRYASHDRNFDPKTERKVRDLLPGESVLSYPVKTLKQYEADEKAEAEVVELYENLNTEETPTPEADTASRSGK